MRVRQADIARAVGISQPAVSVVLRGRGDQAGIPPGTQRRVWEVARRLGYAPNPVAQNLRGSETRLIGVHSFEAVFPLDRRDYYYEFLLGVEEQAEVEGYDLVLFTSTAGAADRRRELFRDGVNRLRIADGSVLLGRSSQPDELARLAKESYPFVHIGRRDVPGARIPYVGCDYAGATEEAVSQLLRHGHRRLAYVGIHEPFEPQADRRRGFDRAVRRGSGLAVDMVELAELTSEWLSSTIGGGTTALVVESGNHAVTLASLLAEQGIEVPAELSVVVLDQGTPQQSGYPAWSRVTIPRALMGREAVRVLVQGFGDSKSEQECPVLPCGHAGPESIAAPPRR